MHIHSMGKLKSQIRHLIMSQELFYLTQVTKNKFGDLPISIPSGYTAKLIIGFVMMFLNYSGEYEYHHTNTSKYGVWNSTSSMGVLQEIILMMYHIVVISWDIQLLHESFSTGNQTSLFLSTEPIIFGLMNVIIVFPYKTITRQVFYSFKNILKLFSTIWTSSTLFLVNLILHPLHFVIQKFPRIKFSYLHMERN